MDILTSFWASMKHILFKEKIFNSCLIIIKRLEKWSNIEIYLLSDDYCCRWIRCNGITEIMLFNCSVFVEIKGKWNSSWLLNKHSSVFILKLIIISNFHKKSWTNFFNHYMTFCILINIKISWYNLSLIASELFVIIMYAFSFEKY